MGAQHLVAFLALQDRPQIRDSVAGRLWSETTDEHARASLRSALWRLRGTELDLVRATALEVSLVPSVSVDVRTAVLLARHLEDPDDDYPLDGLNEAAFSGCFCPTGTRTGFSSSASGYASYASTRSNRSVNGGSAWEGMELLCGQRRLRSNASHYAKARNGA
jgi:hypothetical protein